MLVTCEITECDCNKEKTCKSDKINIVRTFINTGVIVQSRDGEDCYLIHKSVWCDKHLELRTESLLDLAVIPR
jgi:hypothetical protein